MKCKDSVKFKKPTEIRRSELSINIVSADKSAEIYVIVYTIIYNGFGLFVGAVIHLETLGRILDADGVKPLNTVVSFQKESMPYLLPAKTLRNI